MAAQSKKILQSKLISDDRPMTFQGEVNQFLATHEVSKVSYSTARNDSGMVLFTAFILYFSEPTPVVGSVFPQINGIGSVA